MRRFAPSRLSVFPATILASLSTLAMAREWQDTSGRYKVEADFVSADKTRLVVENEEGELLILQRDQLSEEDQAYVSEKVEAEGISEIDVDLEAEEGAEIDLDAETPETSAVAPPTSFDSTWELGDGQVIKGHLEGFGRQTLVLERMLGDILVNGRKITELPDAYRRIVPDVVSHVDNVKIRSLEELENHLAEAEGRPVEYVVEGLQLDLKSFGRITIPIELLKPTEAERVMPGFERWKASQAEEVSEEDRYDTEARERLMLDSYQRARKKTGPSARKIKMMELTLLATASTNLDLWEVTMRPPNPYAYPRTIVVPADNSLVAQQIAASKYPSWQVGATVSLSEF